MKTAISLPDSIFHEAEAFAKRAELSRSELYATALAEYLARRNGDRITVRLDAVYGSRPGPREAVMLGETGFPASRSDLW